MNWPTLAKEITLQLDFATAAIALIALVFSVWSFVNQRRITIETLRIQRDDDVIGWTNAAIETLVEIEFLLRSWSRFSEGREFIARRDGFLSRLSATIDKGRMYFPNFTLDIIEPVATPKRASQRPAILDHLVEIYDLIKDLDLQNHKGIQDARTSLLMKKRAFVSHARSEVDPQRRAQFLKAG